MKGKARGSVTDWGNLTTHFSGDPRLDSGPEKERTLVVKMAKQIRPVDYLIVLYQCEFYYSCICAMVTYLGGDIWEFSLIFAT